MSVGQATRWSTSSAGTILLDATADIDGVSHIVTWREHAEVPQAHYENLDIVHVRQHTTTRLSEYFRKVPNRRAYADWMIQTIKEHMKPGELGLVVCKLALFENQHVPNWPEGDERFKTPELYTEQHEWDIEGRKLCATHWGTGIGSNAWKDADVVFLFDEFHIPSRIAAATVQGLREQRANEGDLATMSSLSSQAPGPNIFKLGHRLRWFKQMALRGCARTYDAHGMCGKQRLVVACELKSFMVHAGTLFPGAKVRTTGTGDNAKWIERVIDLISRSTDAVLTTAELGKRLHKPWREVSFNVLTPEFLSVLAGMGWRYVSRKGRGGCRFERMVVNEAIAA